MDLRRPTPLDWLTGFFGAALVGLLWAPWYQGPAVAFFHRTGGAAAAGLIRFGSVNGWQAMAVNDVILLIAGLMGIWVAVSAAVYSTSAVPIAAATFATWVALLAAVLAVIRVIFPPDIGPGPTLRASGVWLAMDAAIGLLICAAASMRSERRAAPGTVQVPITDLPAPRVSGESTGA